MKIRVITKDFEYQGLYAGSEHEVESYVWVSVVGKLVYSFKVHGKLWKLHEGECEEVPAPNEKLMDVISTDLKKEDRHSSFYDWEQSFFSSVTSERYGQAFCNEFIKVSWPELFYADTAKARSMVVQWLIDNHYWPNVPDTNNQLDDVSKES